jgi:hypothetical protein
LPSCILYSILFAGSDNTLNLPEQSTEPITATADGEGKQFMMACEYPKLLW